MRLLIFLGLKVVEIGVLVFVPYLMGHTCIAENIMPSFNTMNFLLFWIRGFCTTSLLMVGIFIVAGFGEGLKYIIKKNWHLAGKILGK